MIGIYKIENLVNHKKYIGQSTQLTARWRNHKNSAFNSSLETYEYPLYKAMRKYGINNFDFTVIEKCKEEELDIREQYWINYYKSFGENGYNQTPGGKGKISVLSTQVTELFNKGYSIDDLCEMFSVQRLTITNILHSKGLGYLTQDEKNKLQPNCRAIEQYDLNGNLLNTYYSARYAAKLINSNRVTIQQACIKYRIVNNFIWKFQNDPISILEILNIIKERNKKKSIAVSKAVKERLSKLVNQYTVDGKYIKTYPSAKELENIFKVSTGIRAVCRGERKTAYGFIWRYTSDEFPQGKDLNINDIEQWRTQQKINKNAGGGG